MHYCTNKTSECPLAEIVGNSTFQHKKQNLDFLKNVFKFISSKCCLTKGLWIKEAGMQVFFLFWHHLHLNVPSSTSKIIKPKLHSCTPI